MLQPNPFQPNLIQSGLTQAEVAKLIARDEGPTLEFKRELYRLDDENPETKKRQRDELIKDILALANGNAIVAGDEAFLVIGADDVLGSDGRRPLFDVGEHRLTAKRILDIINKACEPSIEDVSCDDVVVDGKHLLIITIDPTPYLHETTRRLETSSSVFSERTAFIRHNQSVEIASNKERETVSQIKRFRFGESRNPPGVPFGTLLGSTVGGLLAFAIAKSRSKLPDNPETNAAIGMAGAFFGGTLGLSAGSIYKNIYEIRSDWHKVPPIMRVPLVVGSFAFAAAVVRAAGFVLKKILPKPKS